MEARDIQNSALIVDAVASFEAFTQWERLLNNAFAVEAGRSFFDDFPVWRPELSPPKTLRLGVFSGSELASAAAVRIAKLKGEITGADPSTIAIIGGVVTAPAFRERGLASRLVEFALDWVVEQGANSAYLFSSPNTFYERMGFRSSGAQFRVSLDALGLPERTRSFEFKTGWNPAIFQLLSKRPLGLLLEPSDLRWVSAHRNVQWYWSGDSDHPTAYAAIGKGIDLAGIVHEWGGERESLRGLLAAIAQEHGEATLLGCEALFARQGFSIPSQMPQESLCLEYPISKSSLTPWFWGVDGA